MTTLDEGSKSEIAAYRGVEPLELQRHLRGDLDWITLKAIAHDPAERYSSAADLAADVERFLVDEPVSAHAPTAGYLLRKLMRRYRARFLTVALVATALVLGAIGTTVGLVRAQAEAERANREAALARAARDRAVESQQTSDQLAASLVELFESIDSNDPRSANLTPHELLRRGVEAVEARLSDQPRARAVLLATIGDIFTQWDDFPAADSLPREAVRMLEAPDVPPGAPLVRALRKLIYVSTELGRPRQALEFAERGLLVQEELGEEADPYLTARLLVSGGDALRAMRRLEEADSWLRRGIDMHRRDGSSAVTIGIAYTRLGLVGRMRKDWPEMIEHNQTAIELFELRAETNYNRTSVALGNIAIALMELGRLSEAETALARSRELPKRALGPDAPRLTEVLFLEGLLWSRQGEFVKSEAALRRFLELRRQRRPASDPLIGEGLDSLGWTIWLSDAGRSREAVARLIESLDIFRQASYPVYPGHMDVLFHLGQIDLAESRPGRAESRYREALEVLEGFEEPNASDLAEGYLGLGRSLFAQDRGEEAHAAFEQAVTHLEPDGDAEALAEARAEIEELG